MKKFPGSLVLVLLFSSLLYSQWSQQNFNDFKHVYCIDIMGNIGVIGGWGPSVLPLFVGRASYSTDAGETWSVSQLPDSVRTIQDMQIINENLIYASGTKISSSSEWGMQEIFLQSTNGGQSWQVKGTFPDSVMALCKMDFIDANTGYILAYVEPAVDGIMKTTDGGVTWNWSFYYEPAIKLHSISFADNLKGFASGYTTMYSQQTGLLLFTTNGGVSWNRFAPSEVMDITHVKCISPDKIVALGEHGEYGGMVIVSTDGGTGWSPKKYISAPMVFSGVDAVSDDMFIVYGVLAPTGSSTPFVYMSNNMGNEWFESTLSPLTNINMYESKIISYSEWFISGNYFGQNGFLLHTTTSGGLPVELSSFTIAQVEGSVVLNWITASEINNRGFEIQRKTNSSDFATIGFVNGMGTTTEMSNYFYTDVPENVSEILIYRLKQIDYDGTFNYSAEVSINFESLNNGINNQEIPSEFILMQNYPNPFNPSTRIKFAIPASGFVSLKVYDMLGCEISSLVNEVRKAGIHSVSFSAVNLPAGMYFYELKAEGFSSVKKMLLVK
jgi:photosystem II stability/assembly factor-like uncharacterized protein